MKEKILIYQVLPRLFRNHNTTRKENGTLKANGCGKLNNFDEKVLARIHDMGFTYIWYTGIIRHATQTDYSSHGIPTQHAEVVKGKAGSPYAITDYYDVDPDLAENVDERMVEWERLISRTHKEGMKVIMDFVPNHVAREYQSVAKPKDVRDLGEDDDRAMHFSTRNNFYYTWGDLDLSDITSVSSYTEQPARATGNDNFSHRPGRNDWYETVKLNYGIDYCDAGGRSSHFTPTPDTWLKMADILLFWAGKGVDGFRCDMAEMVPAEFWTYATHRLKAKFPHIIIIGEVYNPSLYRTYIASGFDYLYDKVGMYDCLRRVVRGEQWASGITNEWQQTDDIRQHMLYFLENHDEQRIASPFFCGDARKALPAAAFSLLFQQNPFMLYAGQEFGERGMDKEGFSGEDGRTTIFDYWSPSTLSHAYEYRSNHTIEEKDLAKSYRQLIHIANEEQAVQEGATFDLGYANFHSSLFSQQYNFAFLRKADNQLLLVVLNFSAHPAEIDVVIPAHAFECLAIPEGEQEAIELLTKCKRPVHLQANGSVMVSVPAYGTAVLKFVFA